MAAAFLAQSNDVVGLVERLDAVVNDSAAVVATMAAWGQVAARARGPYAQRLLMHAVAARSVQMVYALLDGGGAHVSAAALDVAAGLGFADVEAVLRAFSPLRPHRHEYEEEAAAGAPPQVVVAGDDTLVGAAAAGNEGVVAALLRHGASPNGASVGGARTPLTAAAAGGHAAVIRELLQFHAEPDRIDFASGATPLMVALHHGHAAAARALLEGGASVEGPPGACDRPVLAAACSGFRASLEVVLDFAPRLAAHDLAAPMGGSQRQLLRTWMEGRHPRQLRRLELERAALEASPRMPADVAAIIGDYELAVWSPPRRRTAVEGVHTISDYCK